VMTDQCSSQSVGNYREKHATRKYYLANDRNMSVAPSRCVKQYVWYVCVYVCAV
jgi:hypothetical protein